MSAWTDLAITILATWPPAAGAFYANWVKTRNHVNAVAQAQNDDIAAITNQAVIGQNADFKQIAADAAIEQTRQLLETWPPPDSKVEALAHQLAQNPEVQQAVEQAAAPVLEAAGKDIMHYVIAPAKRHVDAWLAQNHIDPSQVKRVTNPDTLDGLDGQVVVLLNPGALTGPAAESAEKARELGAMGKVTLRTDQT